MIINPKKGILLIRKHKKSQIKADIVVEESEEDKRLITGEVLSDNDENYKKGTSIIFGKYSIFPLTFQGEDFFFIDKEDIIGITDYHEN